MKLADYNGEHALPDAAAALERIRTVRIGTHGWFRLWHAEEGPALELMVNGHWAYVYYFPDLIGDHAGFQSVGMAPPDAPAELDVWQSDATPAGGFLIDRAHLVTLEAACTAAEEFFRSREKPTSVQWMEL
ncbi:MAG TPA: Imm1 family immunity protein [Humisphaera sp.]